MNGLLLINKPSGCTSHDVVAQVRRILGLRAIGHAGTLDPLASGLLVLLVGEGTKVSDYILNGDKTYEVKVLLGIQTDTQDIDGKVLREEPVHFALTAQKEKIIPAVMALSGEIELKVPAHSAVKIDGKKLYEYARQGVAIETPLRKMGFYDLEILETGENFVRLKMRCSKGTFVRAWAEALGEKLGCGGAVAELKRTNSEPFALSNALSPSELEAKWDASDARRGEELGGAWVPLRDSLPGFRLAWVEGQDERLLRNGQISRGLQAQLLRFVEIDRPNPGVRVLSRDSQDLVALLLAEPGQFYRIKRVFQIASPK